MGEQKSSNQEEILPEILVKNKHQKIPLTEFPKDTDGMLNFEAFQKLTPKQRRRALVWLTLYGTPNENKQFRKAIRQKQISLNHSYLHLEPGAHVEADFPSLNAGHERQHDVQISTFYYCLLGLLEFWLME